VRRRVAWLREAQRGALLLGQRLRGVAGVLLGGLVDRRRLLAKQKLELERVGSGGGGHGLA
jgi:hypothetical protein